MEKLQIDLNKKYASDQETEVFEVEDGTDQHINYVVASNVKLDFRRFVRMLTTHDLGELLVDDERSLRDIVIPADLLADISNAEMAIQKKAATTNIYSGIFMYGATVGVLIALIATISVIMFHIPITLRDIILLSIILVLVLFAPFLIIASEPTIQSVQKKHRDYLERMTEFLSGR
jgi:hypothetical protein